MFIFSYMCVCLSQVILPPFSESVPSFMYIQVHPSLLAIGTYIFILRDNCWKQWPEKKIDGLKFSKGMGWDGIESEPFITSTRGCQIRDSTLRVLKYGFCHESIPHPWGPPPPTVLCCLLTKQREIGPADHFLWTMVWVNYLPHCIHQYPA